MKLVTFETSRDPERIGVLDDGRGVLDLGAASSVLVGRKMPNDLLSLIKAGEGMLSAVREMVERAHSSESAAALWLPLSSVRLLAPVPRPQKNIFCVGRNYRLHIIEAALARGYEPSFPKVPEFFSKPLTTVIGPEAVVERHAANTEMLDYEVELAV